MNSSGYLGNNGKQIISFYSLLFWRLYFNRDYITANKPKNIYNVSIVYKKVMHRGSGMLEKEEVVAEKVRFEELTVWKSGESVPGRKQPTHRKAQR